jgi:translation initiation factor 5B
LTNKKGLGAPLKLPVGLYIPRNWRKPFLFSLLQISRASIDACKDYYRDDLQKSDWQLMIELKKIFSIM